MYHVRYTRRRTTDSFVDDEEATTGLGPSWSWSWRIFIAVLFIQVTSRSLWTSLGIIGCTLLKEDVPAWHLLAAPTAFAICWGVTEECMRRVCARMGRADDFMYAILGGTGLHLLGALIAVQCHINTLFLVLLLGIVGACGASMSATASLELARKHFRGKPEDVRYCQQYTAAASFFLLPVLSCYVMDTYGESGGLLIHSGFIMQALIGGVMVRGAKWVDEAPVYLSDGSDYDEETAGTELQTFPPSSPRPPRAPTTPPSSPNRVAFGLMKPKIQDAEVKRQLFALSRDLPSISEEVEQDEDEGYFPTPSHEVTVESPADPETSTHKYTRPSEVRTPSPSPEELRSASPDSEYASHQSSGPSSPVSPVLDTLPLYPVQRTSLTLSLSPAVDRGLVAVSPVSPKKPARTFQHVFPAERLVVDRRNSSDRQIYDCETGEIHDADDVDEAESVSCPRRVLNIMVMCFQEAVLAVAVQTRRARPLAVLAALLFASSQTALLTFAGLTPLYLHFHVHDGSRLDGAYTLCIMGFTWLCLVLAWPCCSNRGDSSHRLMCVLSLFGSSACAYLMSQVATQDEFVLYGSLFGLFYGVSRLTTRRMLQSAFGGDGLDQLGLPLSLLAGAFHVLIMLIISQCDIGDHIKQLYQVPAYLLLVSAIFWAVQSVILSVQERRGAGLNREISWSRKRRVSWH